MDETPILVETRAGYRVITLNRPQRLNAFTEAMGELFCEFSGVGVWGDV